MLPNIESLYSKYILAKPKQTCLLVLLVSLLFIFQIPNFRLDASSDTLVIENDADLAFYREIKNRYGSDDFLIMTFSPQQDLFTVPSLKKLQQLSNQLIALNGVSNVISILNVPLINSPAISAEELQQRTPTLLSHGTDQQLAKTELISSPLYRDLLISSNSNTTALLIYLKSDEALESLKQQREHAQSLVDNKPLSFELRQALSSHNTALNQHIKTSQHQQAKLIADIRQLMTLYSSDTTLHLGGIPMITADSIAFIQHDLTTLGVMVLIFIIITLAIAFSRLQWVVLPLVTCFVTGAVMLGLLAWLNWPVTVVSSNFLSLMLILTLSLTIHLVVRYQELHWQNPQASQLILVRTMLRKKFIPCLFTAVTTIVAFVSLVVSGIRPVIDFGWMMTLSITVSFIMAFTFFPAMLMLLPVGQPVNQQNLTKRLVLTVAQILFRNKLSVAVSYLIIILLCVIGISSLTVENRFIDYFKPETEIYQGMALIDKELGGTTPLDIIINAPKPTEIANNTGKEPLNALDDELDLDFDESDLFDDEEPELASISNGYWFNPTMLEEVRSIHHYLDSQPQLGKVLSVSSGLSLINQIEPKTKNDNFTLSIVYSKLPLSVKSVIIDPYISQDGNQIRFSIRVFESDRSLKREELLDNIKQGLVNNFDLAPEQIQFSGMLVLYNNMLQSLFDSQIYTLGTVFFCIFLMFLMLYRNISLSLITLVPNLVAAAMVLGLMGWLNIPLDIMTITIAAICVGIAVDDSIHYVHRFKVEYAKHQDYQVAILNSHASIGRAMYYTSITITFGFSIFVLSNFNPSMFFGLLTGFAMLVALIANLTLLPLLLMRFKPL
ncbi:RND family transporter [Psychrobium sp. 1_MG-2023]|uniref:efflux RND transporter permease subunit n=1 Tax=Psychrobium sp. 1_MG-2023 TaxID=3062624 RepID=UPI000C33B02E|nr:MMPL family transporter [Psychrobium sp. 1_MG-2023]MDP2562658.1 MMPL family transporter [Psychrobium sp. 1_MG-2023]PKF53813.1 transporter [Alteromonadales bacterium alter-6D02]